MQIEELVRAENVIARAREGRLTKHALATMLTPEPRRLFLAACAAIEADYTHQCATDDPCLASGCSVDGAQCLQPVLRAGTAYHAACGAAWAALFADPANRISYWRSEALAAW